MRLRSNLQSCMLKKININLTALNSQQVKWMRSFYIIYISKYQMSQV